MTGEISANPSRVWETKADDSQMHCYLGMKGRITLREIVDHFAEKYPHVDPMTLNLNYATCTWSEPPTAEDQERRAAHRADSAQRHARWERETYEKLKAKFDPT